MFAISRKSNYYYLDIMFVVFLSQSGTREGKGVLELYFDGVCGPRSETPTHI